MWQTVDYKGNTVKWYEAELIERIKELCQEQKRYYVAQFILDLIKSYEGEK